LLLVVVVIVIVGTMLFKKATPPSFQIGSGWNLAGLISS